MEDNKKSSGENVLIAIGIGNVQQSAMIAKVGWSYKIMLLAFV